MKLILLYPVFLLAVSSAFSQSEIYQSVKLHKNWETKGFDTPESVCLDKSANTLYISNIGGVDPVLKDNNGFISKLKPDGTIEKLKWVEGLNAPKGMTIIGHILYVTDIDKIVAIDIKTGKIENTIPIEGAEFLNDLASTKNGVIFVSDSKTKSFYKILDNKAVLLCKDESFAFPNGILVDQDIIISGVGDRIIKIDATTGKWENFINETGGVDGLQKVSENKYIISDWSGKVHIVIPGKEKELLLDTTPIQGMNAADMQYDASMGILYIPTFQGNSISCYKLNL